MLQDPLPDPLRVTLSYPTGGQTLTEAATITWTTEHHDVGKTAILSIDLEYVGGQTDVWQEIASDLPNTGSHIWDVSALEKADDYRVRITVTDEAGLTDADSTTAPFSIWERIFITDADRREWDITHAVRVYDMLPENFRQGLGAGAIRPIVSPSMIGPGEPGYPEDGSTVAIMGTVVNGDARAYPMVALQAHEAVNDVVGGVEIAALY
jgi:hypothetical protein